MRRRAGLAGVLAALLLQPGPLRADGAPPPGLGTGAGAAAPAAVEDAVVLPDGRSRADRLFLQGSLSELRGDWRQARQSYAAVLALDTTLTSAAEALFELGLKAGDREAQDLAGDWLLEHRPGHPLVDRWLDRLYLDGDPPRVQAALERLPAESHLLLRIQLELDRPDAAAARKRIQAALELGDSGRDSLVGEADLFWEQVFGYARRFDRLDEVRGWIAGSPWAAASPWAWHVQARIAWLQEDLPAAFAALGRGEALDGADADLPLLEGRLAFATGDDARACAAFARADSLDPRNPDVLEPWALAAERDGDVRRAEGLRRLLLGLEPGRQDGWLGLAAFLERRGRAADAVQVYREAVRVFGDESAPVLLNNLAYTLAVAGLDLDEALALSLRAVKLEPDSPSFLDTLGWTLFRLGRLEEAEGPLLEALERTTPAEAAEILEHIGALRAAQGRVEEAREACRRALELDPDNDGPRRTLRALAAEPVPADGVPQQATE